MNNMRGKAIFGGIAMASLLVTILAGCASDNAETPTVQPSVAMVEVTYIARVSQPGNDKLPSSAVVTYATDDGTEQRTINDQLDGPDGEEGMTFVVPAGSTYSMSIQNKKKTGLVICAVNVDGVQDSKNYTNSGYGVASCSGIAR